MKVEQEKTVHFDPITIILETKEEADLMWAALNATGDDLRKRSHGHIEYPKGNSMWVTFNEVHPTGW